MRFSPLFPASPLHPHSLLGSCQAEILILNVPARRTATPQRNYAHFASVNDLALHSNQGELISCDQNGAIKVWDLGGDRCSHELVRFFSSLLSFFLWSPRYEEVEEESRQSRGKSY